jgi:hypothetical protein
MNVGSFYTITIWIPVQVWFAPHLAVEVETCALLMLNGRRHLSAGPSLMIVAFAWRNGVPFWLWEVVPD